MKTERDKFQDVQGLFDFILAVQDQISPQVVSQKEAAEGAGRKGVLFIKGSEAKFSKAFEVDKGLLRPMPNFTAEEIRTGIVFENVDCFLKVVKELLAGNVTAFSRARARGDLRVVGDYAIRDAMIFNDLLGKIGVLLGKYNVKIGED